MYGEWPLNRSQGDPELRFTKQLVNVKDIVPEMNGQEITVRARLHNVRGKGGLTFLILRDQFSSIQAILQTSETISKGMISFASKVPKESIVELKATVTVPEKPVETCTQKTELVVKEFWVVNKSAPMLPF